MEELANIGGGSRAVRVGLRPQPGPQPAAAGRVPVLEDERLLEGDAERRGEQYAVRRPVGELWLPARATVWIEPGSLLVDSTLMAATTG